MGTKLCIVSRSHFGVRLEDKIGLGTWKFSIRANGTECIVRNKPSQLLSLTVQNVTVQLKLHRPLANSLDCLFDNSLDCLFPAKLKSWLAMCLPVCRSVLIKPSSFDQLATMMCLSLPQCWSSRHGFIAFYALWNFTSLSKRSVTYPRQTIVIILWSWWWGWTIILQVIMIMRKRKASKAEHFICTFEFCVHSSLYNWAV